MLFTFYVVQNELLLQTVRSKSMTLIENLEFKILFKARNNTLKEKRNVVTQLRRNYVFALFTGH